MTETFGVTGWPGDLLDYSFAGNGSVDGWDFDGYVVPGWNSTDDTFDYPEMSSTGPSPSITGDRLSTSTKMGNGLYSAGSDAGSERWHAYSGEAVMFLQNDGPLNATVAELHFGSIYVDCVNIGEPKRMSGVVTGDWDITFDVAIDDPALVHPGSVLEVYLRYWDGLGNSGNGDPINATDMIADVDLTTASTAVSLSGTYDPVELGMEPTAWMQIWLRPLWGANGAGRRFPITPDFPARNSTLRVSDFALTVA